MAYRKLKWKYANVVEIRKSHTYLCNRKGEKRNRSGNEKVTPEQSEEKKAKLKKHNEIESIKTLDRILTANFDENDQHVVLTYRNDELPTIEDSKKILKNFLNRARRFYAKHNVEFKYVFVTEWNAKRIHHHIVCNSIPGVNTSAEISRLWGHGGAHLTPLYEDKDFNGLAEYLVKETKDRFRDDGNPYKQRYSCSRNLIRPEAEKEIIHGNTWSQTIKVPKKLQEQGYYLDRGSVRTWTDWEGFINAEYKFVKPTAAQLKRERKHEKQNDSYLSKYIDKLKLTDYSAEESSR